MGQVADFSIAFLFARGK